MNLKINGIEFKVLMKDTIEDETEENVTFLGMTYCADAIIEIKKGMNIKNTKRTIIHELVHAYKFAYGYTLCDEESWCDFIAAQIDNICDSAIKIYDYFFKGE